jgi:hypothetical protein
MTDGDAHGLTRASEARRLEPPPPACGSVSRGYFARTTIRCVEVAKLPVPLWVSLFTVTLPVAMR